MTQTNTTAGPSLPDTAPLPAAEVVSYETAPADRRAEIEAAMAEIDINDSTSILFFGTAAQDNLTAVADEMLEGVRNKETGAAGQALNEMVATLRGLPLPEANKKRGILARLLRGAGPVARMLQQYEQVRGQVDAITNRLDAHTSTLMRDIAMLDRLYEQALEYFRRLEVYIAAGEERLRRLDTDTLPALAREAEASGDVLRAQQLGDLRAKRDDLERRVHDLKLTRQIMMQTLPSIRIVQQNDKALVGKIASTIANTVPLWRQQLVMALTIARSAEAGETLQKATDLTNELLTANAETLRSSTQAIRTQVERGVVDIAAVKRANDALIATIDDALRIADEGKRQRAEAERQLAACETELKQALAAARLRARPAARELRGGGS
ncbi:MAG TPA: toxic anion resistance protein [Vicinamibacterales bacterium]|nr:toxic anion resistance protein [Vicinamibacterales bacterium]